MDLEKFKIDLKIFKIDRNFYELRDKSYEEIVEHIKENHIKKLRHKFQNFDIELINPQITIYADDNFKYWSYCFRQPKEKFYWKVFLPNELTENLDFDIVEFSYVLFIKYNTELFCIISGSGMNVIKKYIHPTFGIEIYQRISEPTKDNVIEIDTRSIANNISYKKQTYNLNQTISETIEYSDVPTKIKIKIRDELKQNEFKNYDLDENLAILEVGSYFNLRKKIDFNSLKELIMDLDSIYISKNPKQLTLFSKVNDSSLIRNLDDTLLELITDDIIAHSNPQEMRLQNEIIEVVHPSKLERFYECDKFIIRYKFSRGKNDIEVFDRGNLYKSSTKYIFDLLANISDRPKIRQDIFKLNIVGSANGREATYGNLFSHITAEIELYAKKYFKIDGHWYILENEFLTKMNEDAKEYYSKYQLKESILLKWEDGDDEDEYNKSHYQLVDYYILDKVIKDNIELCDILTIKNNVVYFIHVKDGFNTKMRDLYIQIILAAKRLSNDLKNIDGITYLRNTLSEHNERNPYKQIDINNFITKIKKKELRINFVMAFKNNHHKTDPVLERINNCKSNIAKYSLVQVVKEMQQFNFDVNIIDISEIK